MTFTLHPATDIDVLNLLAALGPGGAHRHHVGDEARVLGGLGEAARRGEVVVAYADGALAGFLRTYVVADDDPAIVDCYGVVFDAFRRRGIGGALIDWLIAAAARRGTGGLAEVIVDRLHEDTELAPLLHAREFSEQSGNELTRSVRDAAPAVAPGVRRLQPSDWVALEPVYARSFAHEPRSGRGQASLDGVRSHPWLRADLSVVAITAGEISGFLLAVVWADDPGDLWIETLCASPDAPVEVGADLVRSAMTVARDAGLRTVSVGETSGVARFYERLGFIRTRGWSRHSLLVMA